MKRMVGGLDQCDNDGNEKWSGSGCILKVEPMGFADKLDVTGGKTRRVKDHS